MTPEQAKKYLADHQIKFVLAQFVDIHGVAKAKSVPVSHFEDIITDGAGFAGYAIWGMGQEPSDDDFMAVGDLSTLSVVPWQPGVARIVCGGTVNKKPWPYDTRYVLQQQVKRLADKGWKLNTGMEPEFLLVKRGPEGGIIPWEPSDGLDKPCYDYKGLSRSRAFLERLSNCLVEAGLDVYQIDHEDANGQFEINYTYRDALTSADQMVFFRMAATEIAREFGAICTFMPKAFSNRTGSGMHMHMSMSDERTPNLFMDKSDKRGMGLSQLAYHFMGGILAHARGLCALVAPSVNSYKRLVVGQSLSGQTWAPAYISYGAHNRTAMVRVPFGRLELRLPDSCCNPYLATAAVIAAGLDGVEKQISPKEPRNINIHALNAEQLKQEELGILPQSLPEALDALEKDPLFAEKLGTGVISEFLRLKKMEWVDYHRHVSDWEVRRYLEFY